MKSDGFLAQAESYLRRLAVEIPNRRVGSDGNRAATEFFARRIAAFGFTTEADVFACVDWCQDGASLTTGQDTFEVSPSPYSLGCSASAPLAVCSTIEELEVAEVAGKILLLQGSLAAEQLMPKDFPFYYPEHHQRVIRALESKGPSAIVAATSRDAVMVGSQYPFPLFEDGNFDIPSVFTTEEEGIRLAEHAGDVIQLESTASRTPATGANVVARKGRSPDRRIVVFAHVDSKIGTPGALDNAGGVVILLLVAEMLADYDGELTVELVPMNGEDYYAVPGELSFLARNADRLGEIVLGINVDGAGYYKGKIAYSLYGCPAELEGKIRGVFSLHQGLVEGEAWYQGDHGLFLFNAIPALAITSELVAEVNEQFLHTSRDTPEIVDAGRLVETARAIAGLIMHLETGDARLMAEN